MVIVLVRFTPTDMEPVWQRGPKISHSETGLTDGRMNDQVMLAIEDGRAELEVLGDVCGEDQMEEATEVEFEVVAEGGGADGGCNVKAADEGAEAGENDAGDIIVLGGRRDAVTDK